MEYSLKIADVLKSGLPLTVLLLDQLPDSNDLSRWSIIDLTAFQPMTGICSVVDDADNVLAELSILVDAELPRPANCAAVGLVWNNQGIRAAAVSPVYLSGKVFMRLTVQIQVGPWEL